MAEKCPKCSHTVTVMPNGMVMCHTCGITARTMDLWKAFTAKSEQPDWEIFYEELTATVTALVGLVSLSDDEGIIRLAGGTLLRLNKLNFSEFFTDMAEARKHEQRVKEILEKTGASLIKRVPVPRD